MEFKLSIFLTLLATFLVVLSKTDAASTTNGKLLKFYPITKQQYRDILALTKQQSTVSESQVMETHRSLADWSNTLHSSWNTLFNGTGELNKTSGQKIRSYPMCVIKTQDPVRVKRGARQYHYDAGYAGLAPNVVYPGSSYYGRPPYHGGPHYGPQYHQPPYEEENNDDEANNDDDEPGNNDAEPEDVPNDDENNNVPEKDSNSPIINCVVVIRRKNQIIHRPPKPDTDTDDNNDVDEYSPPSYGYPHYPHYPYPPHKQPPPYAYPAPIPPHGQYPYPYPPHPHPYPPPHPYPESNPHPHPHPHPYPQPHPHPHPYGDSPPYGHPSSRSNEHPVIDPVAVLHYQEMVAEYYKHLHALYMADASTGIPRSEEQTEYVDDDVEASSIEEDDNENIKTQGNDKDDTDKEDV